jgi:hypothetical protein
MRMRETAHVNAVVKTAGKNFLTGSGKDDDRRELRPHSGAMAQSPGTSRPDAVTPNSVIRDSEI